MLLLGRQPTLLQYFSPGRILALCLATLSTTLVFAQPVYRQQNLSGLDFGGRTLDGVDLARKTLRGTSFRNATLRGANLRETDLSGADFTNADLTGANLSSAIGAVVLQGAKAGGANLSGLEVRGSLDGVFLDGADLRGADLSRAYFSTAVGGSVLARAVTDETTRMPSTLVEQKVPSKPPPPVISPSSVQSTGVPGVSAISVLRLDDVRRQWRDTNVATMPVIEQPGNRTILPDSGIILHDETQRLQRIYGDSVLEQHGDLDHVIMYHPNGTTIVSVVTANGRLLRRTKRMPSGRDIVLIDNKMMPSLIGIRFEFLHLPSLIAGMPREQLVLNLSRSAVPEMIELLSAPAPVRYERAYSLEEISFNKALRDSMRCIELDTVNFDFASWTLSEDQIQRLTAVAEALRAVLSREVSEMFLVEGHTDAVGSDENNLALSDLRAETIATILSATFGIPAENLVTQGYGKRYLKRNSLTPERENRRVSICRMTPLLRGSTSQQ